LQNIVSGTSNTRGAALITCAAPGIGHNPPQEALRAFPRAILDVDDC
jgi:hypothetical protein